MIPQDRLVIIAEIDSTRVGALRELLATMNRPRQTGMADPANALVPFERFDNIHFARFVVLDDNTLADRVDHYPDLPATEPVYLCFMADCDGSADELLTQLVKEAEPGLRQIFAFCKGFGHPADLARWLRAHRGRPAASYVNWVGRSVAQARDESRLHDALRDALPSTKERDPRALLAELREKVAVPLTPIPATPLPWRLRNWFDLALLPAILILFLPLIVIAAPFFFTALRRHEQTDPFIPQPLYPQKIFKLREGEDHDVTNQYSAFGALKPGRFRLWTATAILWALGWTARHIYTRGRIARIATIHFAHWILLDDKRRLYFASNYDGGHEAYMDDFINKAGFGLNLVFSNGIAYPNTNCLIKNGAWREQEFKHFQRRHQIPTDVWHHAHPGLTAYDFARNSRIRAGFEKADMNDDEIRRWLAEI
jgi:hypothetical protein